MGGGALSLRPSMFFVLQSMILQFYNNSNQSLIKFSVIAIQHLIVPEDVPRRVREHALAACEFLPSSASTAI